MANPSVSMPDDLLDKIDEQRGNVPRSTWLQEAARARIEAEEQGEWSDADSEPVEAPAQN